MDPLPDLTGIPEPGSVVADKYRLERLLGAGGMGVVISARHVLLGQQVAIKFLLPAAARLHGSSARFLREAKAAAAITSEHVARVLDMGTLPNGAPYLVMEHLSGADLGRLVKTRGPLPPAEAVDLVLQAGEAIAEAHALGIVHRDLKLGNLFLTHRADGSQLVKVLDFGLSKTVVADEEMSEASLTATNVILGSPYYMSPEQIRSLKTVDARADIWALGVILYVMLSGRRPFAGDTASAICASVAADVPPALLTVRADLHPGLDAVIARCLEKDVARRFQHLGELAAAMAPFASPAGAISVERIVRVLPITSAPVVMMPAAPPVPMTAPAAPAPAPFALAEPTVSLPSMTEEVSQSPAQPQPQLPAVGDVQIVPGPAEAPAGEVSARVERPVVGVTWAEPLPEAPPPRRRGVAAAIAGGAGLGALGLGILVWAAARPTLAPAPSAVVLPSPASLPPPAALPTAEPTPTASASADTAPPPEPPPAPASAAPASATPASAAPATTAPTRKPPGGRKPKDPLLDRWK